MRTPREAVSLRIMIGEAARHEGRPLFEAIVLKAREARLAGATVLRGPMGYGHASHLRSSTILRLSNDLPLVIEIVDSEEKIRHFLPLLDEMVPSGLVTLQKVEALSYGGDPGTEGSDQRPGQPPDQPPDQPRG